MKNTLGFLLLIIASNSWAGEGLDLAAAITYNTIVIVDWAQTREIADNPRFYEKNSTLGRYPATKEVNTYFATQLIVHNTLAHILPKKYKNIFYFGMSMVHLDAAKNNFEIGIKLKF